MYSIGVNYIHVSNYYLKWKISSFCSSLQIGMARIYARCIIAESIYCDIKNTNLQIYCCQKILVIKNSYLPQVSWLVSSLQKKLFIMSYRWSNTRSKAKTTIKSKHFNRKMKNVIYITESIYCDIKNWNLKIHCCQKIHVIKKSYLPQVSSFLSSQQKNHLLTVLSDQLKCKAKTKVK